MNETKEWIVEEIELLNNDLAKYEPGTKEYSAVSERQLELVRQLKEIEKNEVEHLEKDTQIKEDKKDRIVRNAIGAAGVILPVGLAIWGTKFTTKWEDGGIQTTTAGKYWFNSLFRRK